MHTNTRVLSQNGHGICGTFKNAKGLEPTWLWILRSTRGRQADRQSRQAGRQAGRQADRQAGRQAGRQADRQNN